MTDTPDWALPYSPPAAQYVQAALANTLYVSTTTFVNGVYAINCPSNVVAQCDFYDVNGNLITSAVTVTGAITINLATTAVHMDYWVTSGTNVSISIQQSGSNIQYAPSGPLQTITASGVYSGPAGDYYAVLIQGGQGGQGGQGMSSASTSRPGKGGDSGRVFQTRIHLVGGEVIVIGQGSLGSAATPLGGGPSIIPALGTHTTIGGYTSASGNSVAGGNAPPPAADYTGFSGNVTTTTTFPFLTQTTGSAGSGANNWTNTQNLSGGPGGPGTIGTGGLGGDTLVAAPWVTPGSPGTGYGSGGGGGAASYNTGNGGAPGGDGAPGVLYLIG